MKEKKDIGYYVRTGLRGAVLGIAIFVIRFSFNIILSFFEHGEDTFFEEFNGLLIIMLIGLPVCIFLGIVFNIIIEKYNHSTSDERMQSFRVTNTKVPKNFLVIFITLISAVLLFICFVLWGANH